MKKLIWAVLIFSSVSSLGKTTVVECGNSHAPGNKIKLEFVNGEVAKATVDENGRVETHLLEVVSKSRKEIFLKTGGGALLKLAAASKSMELTQTANAFGLNFESAICDI